MEETEIVPCRLCLNVIIAEDGEELDVVEKSILRELVPDMNLDITYEPKICRTCNKTMIASYQFINKSRDELLHNYVKTETHSLKGNEKKCDFCKSNIDKGFLAEFKRQKEHFHESLVKCIPEWLAISDKKSVPCPNCFEAFRKQFSFVTTCLSTEEKVRRYCLIQGTNSEGKVNLYEALQFILDSETKPVAGHFISVNKKEGEIDACGIIKTEAVEIKDEKCERDNVEKACSSKIFQEEALAQKVQGIPLEESTQDPNHETKASVIRFNSVIKEEQNEDCNFILKSEDIEIKSEECDEEVIAEPCSSKMIEGDLLTQGDSQSGSQNQQNTTQYILVDGNAFLQPTTTAQSALRTPAQRKRSSAGKAETTAAKQQKVNVGQKLMTGDAPGKRSIGIQVNPQDLIKKCSIGIQVASWEVNTRSIGVNATPSTSNKQVVCKPTVLHTGTTTGVISKEKRGAFRPTILRKSRK